jgi:hypothetical protein
MPIKPRSNRDQTASKKWPSRRECVNPSNSDAPQDQDGLKPRTNASASYASRRTRCDDVWLDAYYSLLGFLASNDMAKAWREDVETNTNSANTSFIAKSAQLTTNSSWISIATCMIHRSSPHTSMGNERSVRSYWATYGTMMTSGMKNVVRLSRNESIINVYIRRLRR